MTHGEEKKRRAVIRYFLEVKINIEIKFLILNRANDLLFFLGIWEKEIDSYKLNTHLKRQFLHRRGALFKPFYSKPLQLTRGPTVRDISQYVSRGPCLNTNSVLCLLCDQAQTIYLSDLQSLH